MIHVNSIHTAADDAVYEENVRRADQIVANLELLKESNAELKSYGLYTEERGELYEESVTDAITKLGQHIIDIIEKAKKLWNELVGKIKAIFLKSKSKEKQVEILAKENPGAAEKIKAAIDTGNLKIADIKDLNAFYRDMDKILDEIDKMEKGDKGIRAKLDKACKKINESNGLKAIVTISGAVTAAGAIYLTFPKIKKAINDSHESVCQMQDRAAVTIEKCEVTAKKYKAVLNGEKANAAKNQDYVSKLHLITSVTSAVENVTTKNHRGFLSLATRLTSGLNTVESKILKLGKHGDERYKKRVSGLKDYSKEKVNETNDQKHATERWVKAVSGKKNEISNKGSRTNN